VADERVTAVGPSMPESVHDDGPACSREAARPRRSECRGSTDERRGSHHYDAATLDAAPAAAAEAGVDNVEFLAGMIDDVPLPAASVDVVVSNCVIDLAPDTAPLFAELRTRRP
jgi:hypothetical protein